MPEKVIRWKIELVVDTNSEYDQKYPPENWNWAELLDLNCGGSVPEQIISVKSEKLNE